MHARTMRRAAQPHACFFRAALAPFPALPAFPRSALVICLRVYIAECENTSAKQRIGVAYSRGEDGEQKHVSL